MKNNLLLYLCVGLLVACNSETKTSGEGEATDVIALKDNDAATQTEPETSVALDETYEGSGTLAETKEEPESQPEADAAPAVVKPAATTDTKRSQAKSEATASEKAPATPKEKPEADTKPETKPTEQAQTKSVPVQANTIIMNVVPDMMKFDKEVFTVVAGQKVMIELENLDGMQHNLVIIKPGTINKVGAAADALARDPKGAQLNYVPKMPEVLHATKLLNPEEVVTLTFTAPTEPGDYPFVCTFPGHWRMMNGIMKVTK